MVAFPALALWATLVGCEVFPSVPGFGSGTVFLWVSADKDTYVSCGLPSAGCPEQNNSFGMHGTLPVANNAVALKNTYVHFTPPTFPEGTVIEEAYVELFHGGEREDGSSDDILIPVAEAAAEWSPLTLTWATRPNTSLSGGITDLVLESQSWSGTADVAGLVDEWLAAPSENYGLVLYWPSQTPGIEKGFASNNDLSRTATDLGYAPRLLIRAAFPAGTSTNDMTLGLLPPDNDLELGGEILMVDFQSAASWPAAWEVQAGGSDGTSR